MLQNNIDCFSEILEAYGFENIPSKNILMFSYKKGKWRLNHYFNAGTITIQSTDGHYEGHKIIDSESKLEDIICKIN